MAKAAKEYADAGLVKHQCVSLPTGLRGILACDPVDCVDGVVRVRVATASGELITAMAKNVTVLADGTGRAALLRFLKWLGDDSGFVIVDERGGHLDTAQYPTLVARFYAT